MNAGHTAERVYGSLRALLLEGGFRPGQRLDPAMLAAELSSSATPIRDALNRLTGEGLVTARTSEGFHTPLVDQIELVDLYRWSTDIAKLSLRSRRRGHHFAAEAYDWPTDAVSHARATTKLLAQLAGASANAEHGNALYSVQARLGSAYCAEVQILPAFDEEMALLAATVAANDIPRVNQLLDARLRRRVQHGAEIVRWLYRQASPKT